MNGKAPIGPIGLVALFATTILYMADLAFYPIAGNLKGAFPDCSPLAMNIALTGSQLSAMVASLAVIPLMRKFSKKRLLMVSCAMFAAFNCGCQFAGSMDALALFRTLSGLGFGATYPLAAAMINEAYTDDKSRRDRYMGWLAGFMGLAGVANTAAAGVLSQFDWSAVFCWLWISLVVLVLVGIGISGSEGRAAAESASNPAKPADANDGAESLPAVSLAAVLVAFAVANIAWFDIATQLSIYLPEKIAGADAGLASFVQLVGTSASFLMGFAFAPLYHRVGRFLPTLVFGSFAIGYGLLAWGCPIWAICAVLFVCGAMRAASMSYYMVYAADILPARFESTGMTLVTISMTAGGFVAPFAITWLQNILGTSAVSPVYPIFAVVMLVGFVLSAALAFRARRACEPNANRRTSLRGA